MKSKPRIPPIITPIAENDDTANSIWYRFFDQLLEYIVNGFPDAPNDGNQYGRQNLSWTIISPWEDAPADNLYYGRVNRQWGVVVEEAPLDGGLYARRGGGWRIVNVGVPSPPLQSVQFNEDGAFGGSEECLFDETNRILYLGYDNPNDVYLATGWTIKPREQATGPRDGNDLSVISGDPNGGRFSGKLRLLTASGGFPSGSAELQTGSTSSGNSGNVTVATGNTIGGLSSSGQLFIRTGTCPGPSGNMTIETGSGQGSGALAITTGSTSSTYSSGAASIGTGFKSSGSFSGSGPLSLFTGDVPDGTNASGDVHIFSGDCLGNSASGDITLTPGSVAAGTPGNVLVDRLALPHRVGAPASLINGHVWTTTAGLFARINGATVGPYSGTGGTPGGASGAVQYNNSGAFGGISGVTTDGTNLTALTVAGAKSTFAATVAGYASINLPHGTAPSSPANGDVWTTTAGVYVRVNGATVGPLIDTAGAGGAPTNATYVTLSTNGTLSDERVLTAGSGISVTDNGAGSTVVIAATGGGGIPYNDVVLADAPQRYYPLDEASGTTADDLSAAASDGTYAGSPNLNQASMLYSGAGASVEFLSANNDVMTYTSGLSTFAANGAFYADAVVNISSTSLSGCVFMISADGDKGFGIGVGNGTSISTAGNLLCAIQATFSTFNSGYSLGTGNKHLALAWHKGLASLLVFADGTLLSAHSTSSPAVYIASSLVGAFNVAGTSAPFSGKIQAHSLVYMPQVIADAASFRALMTTLARRRFQAFQRGI